VARQLLVQSGGIATSAVQLRQLLCRTKINRYMLWPVLVPGQHQSSGHSLVEEKRLHALDRKCHIDLVVGDSAAVMSCLRMVVLRAGWPLCPCLKRHEVWMLAGGNE
jgi:hypothetical protein